MIGTTISTFQDDVDELKEQPTKFFDLYHRFSSPQSNPSAEVAAYVNTILGISSKIGKQEWFDFALGNLSVLSNEDQASFGKSEDEFKSLMEEQIESLYQERLAHAKKRDSNFAQDSESKLEFFEDFFEKVKSVAVSVYRKLNLNNIYARANGGQLLNGNLLLTAISNTIKNQMTAFNEEFNTQSGISHSYTLVDGKKVFEHQEEYDQDNDKIATINGIVALYNSKGNKIAVEVQKEVQANFVLITDFLSNLQYYLSTELAKLVEVARTLGSEHKHAIGLRYNDLTTKYIKLILKKGGNINLGNLPNNLLVLYKKSMEESSSELPNDFNDQILPEIVANFLRAYETNYQPENEAQEKTLLLLQRFLSFRIKEKKFSGEFKTKEDMTKINADNEIFGHDLADRVKLLNLANEFSPANELSDELKEAILGNVIDILSLPIRVVKTNGALANLFYGFVMPHEHEEFYKVLYEIVIQFVVIHGETVERNELNEKFSHFIDTYIQSQDQVSSLYYGLKIHALNSLPGDNYQIHFLELNDVVRQESLEVLKDENHEGVVNSLESGFQKNDGLKSSAGKKNPYALENILDFINKGQDFPSETFVTIRANFVI
jgi:hypothetical protein